MDIMCKVNPEQKKNVCAENGVNIIYLQILKYLYGCMESALLWYNLYSKTLELYALLINTYDRCIKNSTIKDNQCTIAWYVDDTKVLYIDE